MTSLMQPRLLWVSDRFLHVKRHWFWSAVFFPILLTRFAQLLVVYFSNLFPFYQGEQLNHWGFRLKHLLLVWAKWDSGWYLDLIKEGYHLNGPINQVQSNIAFYPLYPIFVKFLSWPIYQIIPRDEIIIGFGVLVSNIFLFGALFFLYKLIKFVFKDEGLAERSIIYMLVFPAAFYFSCVYTESTFLFFAISSFYFAKKNKWLLASLLAVGVSLARPLGVAIVVPLGLIYLDSIQWKIRKIRPDVLLLGLAPAALLLHMVSLIPTTGDILAIFRIQSMWGKSVSSPLTILTRPSWDVYSQAVYDIDRISIILFLLLSIATLIKLPSLSFGTFPLMILFPLLFTGRLNSVTRYCSVLFPCFILLAKFGKNEKVNKIILVTFFTLQIIFMLAWSRNYWFQ